jgi:hypothetical protein
MEYWEFLLQKEGDRSWLPLKEPSLILQEGRYRVVAHSSRANTDVEICVTHKSTTETPPKRRFQKRSRRTNPEGLMVVIPFTYLNPGEWELRCSGDVMSDFLGESWQQEVQFQISPIAVEPATEQTLPVSDTTAIPEPSDFVATAPPIPSIDSHPIEASAADNEPAVSASLVERSDRETFAPSSPDLQHPSPHDEPQPEEALKASLHTDFAPSSPDLQHPSPHDEPQPEEALKASLHTDFAPAEENSDTATEPVTAEVVDVQVTEWEEPPAPPSIGNLAETTTVNPLLEHSLQMLEQVLQQVVEPVLQELEVGIEDTTAPPHSPALLELETEPHGLMLTLDEEAFISLPGEPLTITGQIDILDINQLDGSISADSADPTFQGSLRYELRDPQTSRVLLDVQQPLPEQVLPFTFSYDLEIPPNCETRLILGTIALYSSTKTALATQPFSITADLSELLGVISRGSSESEAEATSGSLESTTDSPQNIAAEEPESQRASLLSGAFLEAIEAVEKRPPLPLQPARGQLLPPQINQSALSQTRAVSLKLPELPTFKSVVAADDSVADTPKPLRSLKGDQKVPETTPDDTVPSEQSHSATSQTQLQPDVTQGTPDADDAHLQIDQPTVATTQTLPETLEPALESGESSLTPPTNSETSPIDDAFQALNIQDRFWTRLNSLATDAELSEWLRTDLTAWDTPDETEEVIEESFAETDFSETEEVIEESWEEMDFSEAEAVVESGMVEDRAFSDTDAVSEDSVAAESAVELEEVWDSKEEPSTAPAIEEATAEFSGDLLDGADNERTLIQESHSLTEDNTISLAPVRQVEDNWVNREIVVEDDDASVPEAISSKRQVTKISQSRAFTTSQPEALAIASLESEEPIPEPILFVPTRELTAGDTLIVRVKLPPEAGSIYVKLWMQDRQSRALLDGPRWLVDFTSNVSGEWEMLTQMIVPFGSVEIRLEAIAVAPDTQQESRKVAVDCVVLPPESPNFLDDLDS